MTGDTSGAGIVSPFGTPEFTLISSEVLDDQSLIFYLVFCRLLLIILSFVFWPLYCMSFVDLWPLNASSLNASLGIFKPSYYIIFYVAVRYLNPPLLKM
jgi:hypothetical protein